MRNFCAAAQRGLLAAANLLLVGAALAGDPPAPLIPAVPKAKGEACVEPTEVMRRSHMEFILHERDETVHGGIRGRKHSLQGCIDCHVSAKPDDSYPSAASEEHFCNACHAYAAVKIDCFECHADHPVNAAGYQPMARTRAAAGPKGLLAPMLESLFVEGNPQ